MCFRFHEILFSVIFLGRTSIQNADDLFNWKKHITSINTIQRQRKTRSLIASITEAQLKIEKNNI